MRIPLLAALALLPFALSARAEPTHVTEVQTLTLKAQKETRFETLPASVAAGRHSVLSAKIPGQIGELLVEPGAKVKAGDKLVQLIARENEARLARADAGLAQAKADLPRLDAEMLRAAGEVSRAKAELARAQSDWERIQKLGPAAVSRRDAETSEAAFKSATAMLVSGEAAQKALDAAKTSAEAASQAAKAARDEAATFLSYATVTAPFDGVITHKRVEVGDLATAGTPLLEMENTALRVEAQIPDSLIANLRLGQQVPVSVTGKTINATVGEIAPASDTDTRTTLVKLDLAADANARVGAFARVKIPTEEIQNIRIPKAWIIERGQLDLVWVKEKGTARLRLVRTGTEDKEGVEITAGLTAGDEVILPGKDGKGTLSLHEGDEVKGASQ